MTAAGQLIPLPVLAPVRLPDQERGLTHRSKQPEAPRPRIYRIPRSGDWIAGGVYGSDGRLSVNPVTGLRINLSV